MSNIEKIVKKYSEKLRENKFNFSEIYLFGSYSKNKQDHWSDIDVAVIADINKITDKKRLLAWKTRRSIDLRIEPHVFTRKDFHNKANVFAVEIKRTGKRIA